MKLKRGMGWRKIDSIAWDGKEYPLYLNVNTGISKAGITKPTGEIVKEFVGPIPEVRKELLNYLKNAQNLDWKPVILVGLEKYSSYGTEIPFQVSVYFRAERGDKKTAWRSANFKANHEGVVKEIVMGDRDYDDAPRFHAEIPYTPERFEALRQIKAFAQKFGRFVYRRFWGKDSDPKGFTDRLVKGGIVKEIVEKMDSEPQGRIEL